VDGGCEYNEDREEMDHKRHCPWRNAPVDYVSEDDTRLQKLPPTSVDWGSGWGGPRNFMEMIGGIMLQLVAFTVSVLDVYGERHNIKTLLTLERFVLMIGETYTVRQYEDDDDDDEDDQEDDEKQKQNQNNTKQNKPAGKLMQKQPVKDLMNRIEHLIVLLQQKQDTTIVVGSKRKKVGQGKQKKRGKLTGKHACKRIKANNGAPASIQYQEYGSVMFYEHWDQDVIYTLFVLESMIPHFYRHDRNATYELENIKKTHLVSQHHIVSKENHYDSLKIHSLAPIPYFAGRVVQEYSTVLPRPLCFLVCQYAQSQYDQICKSVWDQAQFSTPSLFGISCACIDQACSIRHTFDQATRDEKTKTITWDNERMFWLRHNKTEKKEPILSLDEKSWPVAAKRFAQMNSTVSVLLKGASLLWDSTHNRNNMSTSFQWNNAEVKIIRDALNASEVFVDLTFDHWNYKNWKYMIRYVADTRHAFVKEY